MTNDERVFVDLSAYTMVLSGEERRTLVTVLGSLRMMLLALGFREVADQVRGLAVAIREARAVPFESPH